MEKMIGATTTAASATMSERMAANVSGKRKKKGDKVQFHETSFLLLVVDDIERVDDCLHPGVGAPKGHGKPGQESEAELCIAFCRELRDLLMQNVDGAGRQNAQGERKMRINCRCVGDQSVERDERRNGGKDRQQRVEDNSGGHGEQSVIVDTRVDAPKDILPTFPRNFPRSRRAPSTPRLLRSAPLVGNRLIVLELLSRPFGGFRVSWGTRFATGLATFVKFQVRWRTRTRSQSRDSRYRAFPRFACDAPRQLPQKPHRPKAARCFDAPPFLFPRSTCSVPSELVRASLARSVTKSKPRKDKRRSPSALQ